VVLALVHACGRPEEESARWLAAWRSFQGLSSADGEHSRARFGSKAYGHDSVDPPGRPAQLPADLPDFTGRTEQLDYLTTLFLADRTSASPVAVISGQPGVGKSALAVHTAHRLDAAFPDGVLFAGLAGASPDPVEPGQVLSAFLRSLGISGQMVPAHLEERVSLYRSVLAERRVLVVLDDAHSAAQVRPLLPAGIDNGVLITSRAVIGDLVGARHVGLGVFELPEALQLLAAITADHAGDMDQARAVAVVDSCGSLPLAIRIAGSRLAARPGWTVADLAHRLALGRDRLDELSLGDLDVRTSFTLSYNALPPAAARAFRLMALLNAPYFDADLAAHMLDLAQREAERQLESLVDVHLLSSPYPGKYEYHGLLGDFARERLAEEEDPEAQALALQRVLCALAARLAPAATATAGGAPTAKLLGWVEEQLPVLVACVTQVEKSPTLRAGLAAALAESLFTPLMAGGFWAELERCGQAVRTAALRDLDVRAEMIGCWITGVTATYRGESASAQQFLEHASELARQAGDESDAARIDMALGVVHGRAGRYETAVPLLRAAFETFSSHRIESAAASALNYLGEQYLAAGNVELAITELGNALAMAESAANPIVELWSLYLLAAAHHEHGSFATAIECGRRSLESAHSQRAAYSHARALYQLGRSQIAAGDTESGQQCLAQAVVALQRIGDHKASRAAKEELDLQRQRSAGARSGGALPRRARGTDCRNA
jgi:tetratricopeptide (TPR) repeat protein